MSAKITLQLNAFVDITNNGTYCTAVMDLNPNPTGRVALNVDPITGKQTLTCSGGYADLSFQILAPNGAAGKFKAIGIYFKGPSGDAQGDANFDLRKLKLDGDTMRIRDLWERLGRYKGFFVIQRNSDRAVGIIDPDIENEN